MTFGFLEKSFTVFLEPLSRSPNFLLRISRWTLQRTSLVFYFVSMALYLIVLTAMALADKRVVGTRWLAYSVLIEMMRVALQMMGSSIPRVLLEPMVAC